MTKFQLAGCISMRTRIETSYSSSIHVHFFRLVHYFLLSPFADNFLMHMHVPQCVVQQQSKCTLLFQHMRGKVDHCSEQMSVHINTRFLHTYMKCVSVAPTGTHLLILCFNIIYKNAPNLLFNILLDIYIGIFTCLSAFPRKKSYLFLNCPTECQWLPY